MKQIITLIAMSLLLVVSVQAGPAKQPAKQPGVTTKPCGFNGSTKKRSSIAEKPYESRLRVQDIATFFLLTGSG
ncbi:hypothetical protein PCASD_06024 [Puccinia coronata f. sp. avenae]|uniref:Uncharacterized protein n=1 Tax=Puccinia coronata f. sp. avenae TaxID=200324 RepID=A0A2N5V9Z1_9BASI|nr:hypothetical protein PCASD_06024 [Puccinia coronata f. sp. avenae]